MFGTPVLRNEVETDDIIGAPTPADTEWRTPGTGRTARHGGIREPVAHSTTLIL